MCSPFHAQNSCAAALRESALALVALERRNVRRNAIYTSTESLSCLLWTARPNKGRVVREGTSRVQACTAPALATKPRVRGWGRRFLPPPVCASLPLTTETFLSLREALSAPGFAARRRMLPAQTPAASPEVARSSAAGRLLRAGLCATTRSIKASTPPATFPLQLRGHRNSSKL